MTIGLFKGVNSAGHKGWSTVYCIICNKKLDVFQAYEQKNIYYCPECRGKGVDAYFCHAHASNVHFKCPFCKGELKLYVG